MFGLPTDLPVPKRQTLAFYYSNFSKNQNTGGRLLQKMIISVSIIYGKSFRFYHLKYRSQLTAKLAKKIHTTPSFPFSPLDKVKTFLSLRFCLQLQALQTLKLSFHSIKVDVMVVRFRKNHPDSLSISTTIEQYRMKTYCFSFLCYHSTFPITSSILKLSYEKDFKNILIRRSRYNYRILSSVYMIKNVIDRFYTEH